ncbi:MULTISPECIES: hypothetical protein [Bacillus subtilis group]|nr:MULTISPECIES: hypothetical protein [Bacillus subtilis group]KAA0829966.1 hypothetical protein EI980_16480 [Bacillus licheniformis]KAA0835322.1 hypothetical protein EI979_20580 [Bacillus paralicheniformis]PAE45716.1 hypothetical protein CHH95_21920 [Bacillus licheniformis]
METPNVVQYMRIDEDGMTTDIVEDVTTSVFIFRQTLDDDDEMQVCLSRAQLESVVSKFGLNVRYPA